MQFVSIIPILYDSWNFTSTYWNFSGKIYSILLSIIFLYFFRNRFKEHNYIKAKQESISLKKILPVLVILIVFGILDGLQRNFKIWDNEKLLFQFLIPGIDEELAYRGILMWLFSTILIQNIKLFSIKINPSILITAILFGIMHALIINQNLELSFNFYYFVKTFIYGFIWGWLVVQTKSILLPIIFHNLSNVLPYFISYLK